MNLGKLSWCSFLGLLCGYVIGLSMSIWADLEWRKTDVFYEAYLWFYIVFGIIWVTVHLSLLFANPYGFPTDAEKMSEIKGLWFKR